jgi:hypothetical protein
MKAKGQQSALQAIQEWSPSVITVFLLFIFSFSYLNGQATGNNTFYGSVASDSNAYSQQTPSDLVWKPCISPFIELLGKGFLSLNVDFRRKESHAISVGIQPFEGLAPDIMYYHFSGKRYRFETGGGFTLAFSNDFSLAALLIHGSVGYRYQKKKGLFFRAGFTPLYVIMFNDKARSNKLFPFPGLSLGYCF